MKTSIIFSALALASALIFTPSQAHAGQCHPNPVDSGVLDCDGSSGEYYCYGGKSSGVWACRGSNGEAWATDCPKCDTRPCDTWIDVYGPDHEAGACVDDGPDKLAAAMRKARLHGEALSTLAWCVTTTTDTTCYAGVNYDGADNQRDPAVVLETVSASADFCLCGPCPSGWYCKTYPLPDGSSTCACAPRPIGG